MAKTGRPKKTLTEEQWKLIANLAKIHCTAKEISAVLEISEDAICDRCKEAYDCTFADFIKKHSEGGKASLRRLQWKAAENGNTSMLIWLGKQYLGQTDKVENTNIDWGSLEIDFSQKNDEN